jgi:hypothetical protein
MDLPTVVSTYREKFARNNGLVYQMDRITVANHLGHVIGATRISYRESNGTATRFTP